MAASVHVWCHLNEQSCKLRPSFTSERTFGLYVNKFLGGVKMVHLSSESTLDGLQPFMIILITAPWSAKTNKDALWLEMSEFGGT